jgi:predicted ATPase
MQKLIIHNFGPIKDLEIDIKDFMIFIGPQASGKSTISKSIYFFKSLKDDLLKYILESINEKNFDKTSGTYAKIIRNKFLEFWGPTYHLNNLSMSYQFRDEVSISVKLNGKYIDPIFSNTFMDGFYKLTAKAQEFVNRVGIKDTKFMSSNDLIAFESQKRVFLDTIGEMINRLFDDDRDLIFIPAGRSLLSTLSEQLQFIQPYKLDYLMRSFLDRINISKRQFSMSLDDIITEKEKLTQQKINYEDLKIAKKIIASILKAEYRYDVDGDRLYYDANKYVKLNYASSGQQESVWNLLMIYSFILNHQKIFIVFEEPEAHLFPEAQKDMIELISLLFNNNKNQIIITTHSPYVLSSINNLLYAFNVGNKNKEEVNKIVPNKLWINPEQLVSYFISKGQVNTIMDKESGLINSETIDGVSSSINTQFIKLLELDN